MRTTGTRAAIAATLLSGSMSAWSLGVGPARVTAMLGQALDVTVPLRAGGSEPLGLDCVEARVFFGEDRLGGSQVRLRLESPPARPGEQLLRISTLPVVNEPVVSVIVTAGCGSALVREFVAFADPPVKTQVPSGASLPAVALLEPPAAGPAPVPQEAPAPAAAAPAARSPRSDAPPAGSRPAPPPAAAPKAPRPAAASPAPAPAPAAVADAGQRTSAKPRLQLEPLVAAPAAALQTAAAASAPTSGAPGVEAERLQAVETTLAELRSELAQTRRTLEAMETRAREAEQARQDSRLVYALGGLALALAAAVAWLLQERRRDGVGMRAWNEELRAPSLSAGMPPPSPQFVSAAMEAGAAEAGAAAVSGAEPAEPMLLAPQPVETEQPRPSAALDALLDLDQQVAFLVALGQEEVAIGLLQSHLAGEEAASPLPWLELLALYQQQSDRAAFDSLGQRFAERFATVAPAWGADLRQGCALEDYQAVVERLEWLWDSAPEAAQLLETLLLRSGGMDNTPDLPACQDLLLLYAMVRERLGSQAPAPRPQDDEKMPWAFFRDGRRVRGEPPRFSAPLPAAELPPLPWAVSAAEVEAEPQEAPPAARPAVPQPPTEAPAAALPHLDFGPLEFNPPEFASEGAAKR